MVNELIFQLNIQGVDFVKIVDISMLQDSVKAIC